jgi:acetyltransferase-like isoleucine patch superfamily enzyme
MRPDAYVVDSAFWEPGTFIGGVPVVSFENLMMTFPEARFLVGMSFKGLNAKRAEKFEAMYGLGLYRPVTYRHNMSGISPSAQLGAGCFVMDLNILQTDVEIGRNCVLWSGNHVGHHTKIGDHVWLSSGIVVSGACKIGKRCIIGAGATITRDCEDDGVYPGPYATRSKVPSHKLKGVWAQ